jgi:hypothetical protein
VLIMLRALAPEPSLIAAAQAAMSAGRCTRQPPQQS